MTFAALVGSLTIGTTFFLSFLVGMLADKIGLRLTAIIGGVLATLGMSLSAVGYKHVEVLYVTYGLMFGTGSSLVYTPSLTILGHYFRRRLGVVNGIVTAGSSLFTIGLSFINQHILETHGVSQTWEQFAFCQLSLIFPVAALLANVCWDVLLADPLRPHIHSSLTSKPSGCQGGENVKIHESC